MLACATLKGLLLYVSADLSLFAYAYRHRDTEKEAVAWAAANMNFREAANATIGTADAQPASTCGSNVAGMLQSLGSYLTGLL